MLVLSRGPKEKIVFPNLGISVEILRVAGNRVRVGVKAPRDVRVLRDELAAANSPRDDRHSEGADNRGMSHELRNRLHAAHLAFGLAQKHLELGQSDEAMDALQAALHAFDAIDSEMTTPRRDGPGPSDGDPQRTKRALLVEDDANECHLLAGYLRLSGFEVDTAGDGLQALIYLSRNQRPDVVLMDMHMPRFDGARAIRSIRENPEYRGIQLFAVTGSDPAEARVSVGPDGVDRWFRKPIDPQRLVDEIHSTIQRSSDGSPSLH